MDQRHYNYEYRRPRHANPTYSSYNVNNSMTFFMGGSNTPNITNAYGQEIRGPERSPQNYSRRSDSQLNHERAQEKTRSHLSSYGTSSLAFNQRDIYNKQNSKFNIISLKPKGVDDQIKVYPKLTLEDKDVFYYEKMNRMREQEQQSAYARNVQAQKNKQAPEVAGRHTFAPEENKNPNHYQHGRYFTPRMLNHADEVSNIM